MLHLNNRGPGEKFEFEAREIIDAGFLELVRYGIRAADDPLIIDSLKVVDRILKIETPRGPCWRRYNHDGYGQRKDGGPYQGFGQGRAWPLLGGERAHYELAAGRDVSNFIRTYESFASEGGMMPEQIWDEPDKAGLILGGPAGSAMPLVWAHAEYLKLLRSVYDGRVYDHIAAVEDRYAKRPRTGREPYTLEVFKLRRPVKAMPAGCTLRVISKRHFRVVWTIDSWTTSNTTESNTVGWAGSFVDLPTAAAHSGAAIIYSFLARRKSMGRPEFRCRVEI